MRTKNPKTFTLPDGKKLSLSYELPAASECKVGDPRHCQHAEGLREAGFGDPLVCSNDKLEIRVMCRGRGGNRFCLICPISAQTAQSIGDFDAKKSEPTGKKYLLGTPVSCKEVRVFGPRKFKRRDAGMTVREANKKFKRKPNADAGRRFHMTGLASKNK